MEKEILIERATGHIINEYEIISYINSGAKGYMFQCRNDSINDDRAIKLIPSVSLREDWDNEIKKVNELKNHNNVVRYYNHGKTIINGEEFLYIMWEFIPNNSLKNLIESAEVTIPILVDVVSTILQVLYACAVANIVHSDLHSGNILIQKENKFNIDSTYRKIWVTDFGCITQHSEKEFMDDYVGLNRLIHEALRSMNFNLLDGNSKSIYRYFNNEFSRYLTETNAVVGEYVRNPRILLDMLQRSVRGTKEEKKILSGGIGDYLAAEHLGDNFEEWKAIFVPKFIAIDELLEKNICVLTGLRGCGKTMLFKRLSSYFNLMIGEPANLTASDSFYGFYLNARDIAEAFPWLPDYIEETARNQIINNFNLNWSLEILTWLKVLAKRENLDLSFLNIFFKKYYPNYFSSHNDQNIYYLIELIRNEIGKSRLHSEYRSNNWPLVSFDFLEDLVLEIKENTNISKNKPFYFFLDDYSLPMVKSTTQRILNPIIFRRSANIIFKISTESVESFEPIGLNGKVLVDNDDFSLIDCGTITLGKRRKTECKDILFSILQPRIERHPLLHNRNLTLENLLGKTTIDNEKRARFIRGEKIEEDVGTINTNNLYQGWEVFRDMWSSDIREMINLFADMVSKEKIGRLRDLNNNIISDAVQNDVYKESGGQFMSLLNAATNPSEKSLAMDKKYEYARHLIEIVKAFQEVASFDLKNKNSKNQKNNPIKKARRIEITNADNELSGDALDYYKGLLRYGIFIRDYRGKSVRGKIVPRLYLRSRLIPFFRLTFSKRDSIQMSWDKFVQFLLNPSEFAKDYTSESKKEIKDTLKSTIDGNGKNKDRDKNSLQLVLFEEGEKR